MLCAFFSHLHFHNLLLDVVSTSVIIADRHLWWWVCSVFAVLRSREHRRSWSLGKLSITPGLNPLDPGSFVGSVGHTVGSSRVRRYCVTPGMPVDHTGFAFLYVILFSDAVLKDSVTKSPSGLLVTWSIGQLNFFMCGN